MLGLTVGYYTHMIRVGVRILVGVVDEQVSLVTKLSGPPASNINKLPPTKPDKTKNKAFGIKRE